MSLQLGGQFQSVPISQEISMNFDGNNRNASFSTKGYQNKGTNGFSDGNNRNASFSTKGHQNRAINGFDGPDWNHQKSFYASDSTAPREALSSSTARYSEPKFSPSMRPNPSSSSSVSRQNPSSTFSASTDVSLGENIDLFVDDKFFKSHNLHYGPAVIHVNGDEPSSGFPNVTGSSSRNRRSSNDFSHQTQSTGHSPFSSASNRMSNSTTPEIGGVNSISIGESSDEFRLNSGPSRAPPPSPSPSPKSVSFSPSNKIGSSFTYGPIPGLPQGKTENFRDEFDQAGNGGSGQIISIGNGGSSGRRTSNGIVSFSSEAETIMTRSDGSPVDPQILKNLRK